MMTLSTTTRQLTIKLLAVMEASTVTGPAKNLIDFSKRARDLSRILPGSRSIETSIVTFEREDRSSQFVSAVADAGVDVDVIAERFRFDPRVITSLSRLVERRVPDIIQTHNVKSHFLLRRSCLWRRHPWIAFHHGYTTTDLKMRAYNHLDRWSLRAAARVVTMNEEFAHQLAQSGVPAERIRVVHNSIDAERVQDVDDETARALRQTLKLSANDRVVLVVGRLSREKGHTDLVIAFNHLLRANPDLSARLVVVGSGPEQSRVEETARSLGIAGRITFTGQVKDVRPYYSIADVLAIPSHSEGSPNMLLEAMAAGVPAVATSVGGVPEIVTHNESALLVNARDPRAMAESIARVMIDKKLAYEITRNARDLVMTQYSPESRLRALAEIYGEVVPGAAPVKVNRYQVD